MSIPVPCAVLLPSGSPVLSEGPSGAVNPGHALRLCNRLASMQSLVCGDAGIKACEAASCKWQKHSVHPSIYSCGEGSGLNGEAETVVKF